MNPRPLFLLALFASPALAAAAEGCASAADDTTFTIRSDNDVWGGAHQDQGYSAGGMLQLASPTVPAAGGSDCLPTGMGWLDRGSAWLGRGEARNVTLSLSQAIYTPSDRDAVEQDPDDRPFAAVLTVNAGRNVRTGNRLATTQLRLGVVGPSARGEEVQDAIHGLWGRDRFQGWDNQLRDEPVIAVVHERAWRWQAPVDDGGLGWDFGTHAGGSLGNLATHLNGGAGVRFGRYLPDDFGSSPLRPGGENAAPVLQPRHEGFAWHLYASFDARAVAADISLDGSTW